MRNHLLTAVSILVFSCSGPTPEQEIRKKAEAQLLPKMNDPASYEFVSLEKLDSVLHRQRVEELVKRQQEVLRLDEEHIQILTASVKYDPRAEVEVAQKKRVVAAGQKTLDSLNALSPSDGYMYSYLLTFRGNNESGGKVLNKYAVTVGPAPEYPVWAVTEKEN